MPKCPYCGAKDMSACVRVIVRRVHIMGALYRWMLVLVNKHDCTDADVWFYPTWRHATDLTTVRHNAEWLFLFKSE